MNDAVVHQDFAVGGGIRAAEGFDRLQQLVGQRQRIVVFTVTGVGIDSVDQQLFFLIQ